MSSTWSKEAKAQVVTYLDAQASLIQSFVPQLQQVAPSMGFNYTMIRSYLETALTGIIEQRLVNGWVPANGFMTRTSVATLSDEEAEELAARLWQEWQASRA